MESKCKNPDCDYVYLWRKKPASCPKCNTYLGIEIKSKVSQFSATFLTGGKNESKKPRVSKKETNNHVVHITDETYSVHNHRHHRVVCRILPGY